MARSVVYRMTIILLVIGVVAGVMSGLFGIGGGIVIVPALIFFARMPIAQATGSSLGSLLLPVGAFGAWEYWRNGNLDVRASLLVALGLFGGVWLGARAAQLASPATLKRGFALLLLAVAVRMWMTAGAVERPRGSDAPPASNAGGVTA